MSSALRLQRNRTRVDLTLRCSLLRLAIAALLLAPAGRARGGPPDVAADLPLWSQQLPLWDVARDQEGTHSLPPADPQPVGTWGGGTALPMHNAQLKVSLWGPPERLTFSLGKTDIWDRRYFPEEPLTLQQMEAACFDVNAPETVLTKHYISLDAYDFPTPKPAGQLILLAPGLEGGGQPVATARRGDGVAAVPVQSGAAGGGIEAMTLMTRNVLAVRGAFTGLTGAPQVRVYRHQDTILPGQSWDHSNGGMRPYPGWDYSRDAPQNGPLDPPSSGSDGRYFWITQAMPPEPTFPSGFWYVFMATVAGQTGGIVTVENQTGLGTDPYMTDERANGTYPGTTNIWPQLWLDYNRIRTATGAAATANLPAGEWLVLATVVTSAEAADPMAEARLVLQAAESTGWAALIAENRGWWEDYYNAREDGRTYFADAWRNDDFVDNAAATWGSIYAQHTRPDPTEWEYDTVYGYLNHDWVPWHGTGVLNSEQHTARYVENRADRLETWQDWGQLTLDAARTNAQQIYNCDGAMYGLTFVPVRTETIYHHNLALEQGMEFNAQMAKMFWDRYDYLGDETFLLNQAWPILLAGAEFYEDFLTLEGDGFYHVEPTVPQEYYNLTKWWANNRNSISALSMIRWHLNTTARAAEILGTATSPQIDQWRAIADQLAPYPTASTAQGPIYVKVDGESASHTTGNLIPQLYPVFLADEITLDTGDERREIMERTIPHITGWGGLSRGMLLLGLYEDLSPEALLNSRSGRMHLFPAATPGVDVGFRHFLARGGFEVSAERVDGEISPLYVTSRMGNDLRLANPWPGRVVDAWDLTAGNAVAVEADPAFPGDPLVHTQSGHRYRIGPGALSGTEYTGAWSNAGFESPDIPANATAVQIPTGWTFVSGGSSSCRMGDYQVGSHSITPHDGDQVVYFTPTQYETDHLTSPAVTLTSGMFAPGETNGDIRASVWYQIRGDPGNTGGMYFHLLKNGAKISDPTPATASTGNTTNEVFEWTELYWDEKYEGGVAVSPGDTVQIRLWGYTFGASQGKDLIWDHATFTITSGGPGSIDLTQIPVADVVGLAFHSHIGTNYRLQYTTNLGGGAWEDTDYMMIGTGEEMTALDPAGLSPYKAYRIIALP